MEAAVFNTQRHYTDDPAHWTVTVVDPTASRGTLRATTTDADTRAIYVRACSARRLATDEAAADRFFERVGETDTVFLDSYVLESASDDAVVGLVGTIGIEGIQEAERLTELVVEYNAEQTTPGRFDGLQYDVEPGTDDKTTMFRDYVADLDRLDSVGAGQAIVG